MKLHINDHIIISKNKEWRFIEEDVNFYLDNLRERILNQVEEGNAGEVL